MICAMKSLISIMVKYNHDRSYFKLKYNPSSSSTEVTIHFENQCIIWVLITNLCWNQVQTGHLVQLNEVKAAMFLNTLFMTCEHWEI